MCEDYINKFGDISKLERKVLLKELDLAWVDAGLNNKVSLCNQENAAKIFYSHPAWVLNGLYSGLDPVSRTHRASLAHYIQKNAPKRVADYGGGSGVLAQLIAENIPECNVEVIEPYAFEYFKQKYICQRRILYTDSLNGAYDIVVAQDVLEHIDNPIETALEIVDSTKIGGLVIFANCFYPEIMCHLPSTFYLRHTFKYIMKYAGLRFIEKLEMAPHVHVFRRESKINTGALFTTNALSKLIGPILNVVIEFVMKTINVCK